MANERIEGDVSPASPELVEQRKQEVAQLLASIISTRLTPDVQKHFANQLPKPAAEQPVDVGSMLSPIEEEKALELMNEFNVGNMESTIGQVGAAIDAAEGSDEDKIAVHSVFQSFADLFSILKSNDVQDDYMYNSLKEILLKLQEILLDGNIDTDEANDFRSLGKKLSPASNLDTSTVNRLTKRIQAA